MQLGDYADGDWFFVIECAACGRQSWLEPSAVLELCSPTDRGMHLEDLQRRLRCRDCHRRQARLEAVPRLPKQAFVAGMI